MSTSEYLYILSKLNKQQMKQLISNLSDVSKEKANNLMKNFVKSKQFRDEVIKTIKSNYNDLATPYRQMSITQQYSPDDQEKLVIQVANESYNKSRKNNVNCYQYLKEDSTDQIAVYQYKSFWTHKIIVAFRGSQDKKDIIPDLYIVRNRHSISDRFSNALKFIENLNKKYESAKLIVTGHSLGGALAIWIRQHKIGEDLEYCYCFNPGYNGYYNSKLNLKFDNLKIFMVKGDIICNTLLALDKQKLPDKHNLVILDGNLKKPLQNHSLKNFTDLI